MNADGYVSTGTGILGFNMFVYCNNNSVNMIDTDGNMPTGVCQGNGNPSVFGWERTKTSTTSFDQKLVPEPSPIVIEKGTSYSYTISKKGTSERPISGYTNVEIMNPIKSSTVGGKINVCNFTLDASLGLDDIGITATKYNGNASRSISVKMNMSEVKVGLEFSSAIEWDDETVTDYVNVSASGWGILFVYALATTGQSLQPAYN